MKKVVLKLDLHDKKAKQKAMKAVSGLPGLDSIAVDMKERKLTVIGNVDPIIIVGKLRKQWHPEIVTVGPAKEEKKDEGKKQEDNKEEGKKEEGNKKEQNDIAALLKAYQEYNTFLAKHYHEVPDDYPTVCVIF